MKTNALKAVTKIANSANTGSQVAREDAHKVFDRFWRGDEVRAGTGTHCGLGLSLAKRAAETLEGSITIESESGGVFRAVLCLPA